jgi:hypothetical protein
MRIKGKTHFDAWRIINTKSLIIGFNILLPQIYEAIVSES